MAALPPDEKLLWYQQIETSKAAGDQLQLQQCSQGYIRLPVVPKHLYKGPRGGVYYITQKHEVPTKVYLKNPQKVQLGEQRLKGVVTPPGYDPQFHFDDDPAPVFARINRQLELVNQLPQ